MIRGRKRDSREDNIVIQSDLARKKHVLVEHDTVFTFASKMARAATLWLLIIACAGINCDRSTSVGLGQFKNIQIVDLAWDISPDGRHVVYEHFAAGDSGAGIYLIHASGDSVPEKLMSVSVPGADPCDLRFAPDGARLTLVRGPTREIWVMELGSRIEKCITATQGNAAGPDWDPSGRLIVYERPFLSYGDPDSSSGLHVVNVDSSVDRSLRHGGKPTYGGDARWSGDSSCVIFTYGSPLHIWRVHANGEGCADLTPSDASSDERPAWLGVSHVALYEAYDGSRAVHETRVIDTDTGKVRKLIADLCPLGLRSAVSRDGSFVVYSAPDPTGRYAVLYRENLLDAQGESRRQLTAAPK